ncbi:MAG: arabinogalactan endo-1,4-beta-galactosidase [Anaerolineae bacterium]|nr:arabinogalactan endo-1,4-beta-galactosidase [Anaerolineae bacterium]
MQQTKQTIWRLVLALAVVGLVVSLLPAATSLYDLTGEETWAGQLRGALHWLNTAVRPQPQLASETPMQNAEVSPLGVNTFLQIEAEETKRARSLELAQQAGFTFMRQEFTWEDIEIHAKGDFVDRRNDPNGVDAWLKYDHIVQLAEEYDIEMIARLSNPPAWSRALPEEQTGSLAPPDDYQDFVDFVTAVASRYQGRIHYYQIWNEPNGNGEWGHHQPVNPEQYTDLLCRAYEAVKAVDPTAVILAGALTPTVELSPANVNDLVFLQRMYNAGAAACFDVMSAQGYGLWSGATDQRLRPTVINFPHHLLIRDLMVRNGDAAKPIWISEMGWNVAPEGMEAHFGRVTEAQQARYAVEAYDRIQAEWPWVGVSAYWFLKRPSDSERNDAWYYFRLLEPDFTPLPVYNALVDRAAQNKPVVPLPHWVYAWAQIRPALFALSAAILFFALLRWLMGEEVIA